MKITVKPSVDFEEEIITLDTIIDGYASSIHREVIKTKEKATRAALIALGWTPPNDAQLPPTETTPTTPKDPIL